MTYCFQAMSGLDFVKGKVDRSLADKSNILGKYENVFYTMKDMAAKKIMKNVW